MSFFNTLKKYFGADDPVEGESDTGSICQDDPEGATEIREVPKDSDISAPEFDPAVKERILDGVLEVFNQALPSFVAAGVDPAVQRRELMGRLDESVAQYMDSLNARAAKAAEARLMAATNSARGQSEQYRLQVQSLEQEKNKIREAQLSADRRRRALSDRVADLENQIAKLEAEKEQFQLENQSLLNKVKLADIQPGVVEDLKAQIEALKGEGEHPGDASLKEELAHARSRIADLEQSAEISKGIIADVQQKMSAANAQAADQAEALRAKVAGAEAEIIRLEAELAEAAKIAQSVFELKSQMEECQVLFKKRDEKIARLKSANKRLKEETDLLRKNLAQAQRTAPSGLFAIEEGESLRDIEDDFQCPEWFVGEPAPGTGNIKPEPMDFGYSEPAKKTKAPENDAQLSLF